MTGDHTGTTDEVIQWAACKWGIELDIARAQLAKESWWDQAARGDRTSDVSLCHPAVRDEVPCAESVGLGQIRYAFNAPAYANENALRSSAFNADFTYSSWRKCYEGEYTWLNTVERGAEYAAGDAWGCLGVWFAGRWYTPTANEYIAAVRDYYDRRIWESADFLDG